MVIAKAWITVETERVIAALTKKLPSVRDKFASRKNKTASAKHNPEKRPIKDVLCVKSFKIANKPFVSRRKEIRKTPITLIKMPTHPKIGIYFSFFAELKFQSLGL